MQCRILKPALEWIGSILYVAAVAAVVAVLMVKVVSFPDVHASAELVWRIAPTGRFGGFRTHAVVSVAQHSTTEGVATDSVVGESWSGSHAGYHLERKDIVAELASLHNATGFDQEHSLPKLSEHTASTDTNPGWYPMKCAGMKYFGKMIYYPRTETSHRSTVENERHRRP
jgi:hypothetical protein